MNFKTDTMDKANKTRVKKITINDIVSMKKREKISVLTSYDYWSAKICDNAAIDILLVGDSGGMVMLGYPSTIPVSMNDMLFFSKAVSAGTKRALIVSDMPFGSYHVSTKQAVKNAIRFIKSGSDAVKLEGAETAILNKIKGITERGIPVMGHIGLRPQTSPLWEGYKVQGNTSSSGYKLLKEAKELEKAGVFAIVLELVTSEVSKLISDTLRIPTIGIGSGPYCDGQVLVLHDILNLYDNIKPRFVKDYANLSKIILDAVERYISDVKTGKFPEDSQTFNIAKKEHDKLINIRKNRK